MPRVRSVTFWFSENFVGVLTARAAAAGWDVRAEGLTRGSLVLYGSAETHTWIQKAADLFGFGTNAIRWIPADAHQRMDVAALRRQIDADRRAGLPVRPGGPPRAASARRAG